MVIDPFGRAISYVRVSVTDRCDFRCVYCMAEDMTFLPKAELLTLEELDRLCTAFVELGVRKLRLTGGEPLVRRNVMWLVEQLGRHLRSGALDELTLTTNGSQLERFAGDLARAGVRRINVSLDTLDRDRFAAITRWGKFDKVMAGIEAAKAAGLQVKINAVALKGVNEDELDRMISWCGAEGFDLTLIETMPLGRHRRRPDRPVSALVAGPRPARRALDARRHPVPDRRPCPLCRGRRDRRPAGLHHAHDPQFLRVLQPRAGDLHRHHVHVPRPGGCRRPARAACAPRRATRRSTTRSAPASPASPRATTSSSTAATTGPRSAGT